jgi:hypothetical protein
MKQPIQNFRLMLIFRISLFVIVFLGLSPSIFHFGGEDVPMYSTIGGFALVVILYLIVRPSYYCFEISRGQLFVATDKEGQDEIHLSIPIDEIIDYRWVGRKVYFYRFLENGTIAMSKPTDVGLSLPNQKKELKHFLEGLKKDHPYQW